MLLLLLACTDYQLQPEERDPDPGVVDSGAPQVQVDPESFDAGVLCEATSVDVTVTNVGDAELEVVDAHTVDGVWSVGPVTLPLLLAPDESAVITVTGGPGDDTLVLESNATDGATLEVPLRSSENQPPEIVILEPTSDAILDTEGSVDLFAQVYDPDDPLDRLLVQWHSDVAGNVAAGLANSTGDSRLEWTGARTGGDHVLTASVVDGCLAEDAVQIGVCQQSGFDTENLDISSWHFEGNASWDSSNGWLELTPATQNAVGSAFQTAASTRGNNVTISFAFYMGGGSGADGFAVTALDMDRMTAYLGSAGGCLGYGSHGADCPVSVAPLPGWTLEVDTYHNSWDPTAEDHLAFMFDGDVGGVQAWATLPEMEDATWHTMEVTVNAPRVTVSIDGTVYLDQDIAGTYDFPAQVGFTAATGGLTNYHLIDALTVTEYLCEEE
jgi:hypothetical protein